MAYKMLEELQQKIYSVYPNVKTSPDEQLRGARVFASEICQRYNSMMPTGPSQADKEAEALAEKRAEEFAAKLKSNMQRMMVPIEETKDLPMSGNGRTPVAQSAKEADLDMPEHMEDEGVHARRKAVLILVVVAIIVYVITGIIYNVNH